MRTAFNLTARWADGKRSHARPPDQRPALHVFAPETPLEALYEQENLTVEAQEAFEDWCEVQGIDLEALSLEALQQRYKEAIP